MVPYSRYGNVAHPGDDDRALALRPGKVLHVHDGGGCTQRQAAHVGKVLYGSGGDAAAGELLSGRANS